MLEERHLPQRLGSFWQRVIKEKEIFGTSMGLTCFGECSANWGWLSSVRLESTDDKALGPKMLRLHHLISGWSSAFIPNLVCLSLRQPDQLCSAPVPFTLLQPGLPNTRNPGQRLRSRSFRCQGAAWGVERLSNSPTTTDALSYPLYNTYMMNASSKIQRSSLEIHTGWSQMSNRPIVWLRWHLWSRLLAGGEKADQRAPSSKLNPQRLRGWGKLVGLLSCWEFAFVESTGHWKS